MIWDAYQNFKIKVYKFLQNLLQIQIKEYFMQEQLNTVLYEQGKRSLNQPPKHGIFFTPSLRNSNHHIFRVFANS